MSPVLDSDLRERVIAQVSEERLVETASSFVNVSSPTGSELEMAELMRDTLESMGLAVTWQEVEDGRPNVVGRLEGVGGGPSLMFNGHMDTSYSGREPHLRGKIGFEPHAMVRDGRIYGLGISNMKGALACYVEAVRAVQDAGLTLRGDVIIAAVVGEIEKTQWGDEFRGKEYRGYAAGSRYLPTASPTCASSASPPSSGWCSATTARCGRASRPPARSCTPRSPTAACPRTRSCACSR
jgi:acetylornithine deacetylase/succinyl-diaminopimelate desuccinylase-like protein